VRPGLLRLLGIAPAPAAGAVAAALARIPGPDLVRLVEGDAIAFAQAEPAGPRAEPDGEATRLRALQLVQRRLEAACLAGPFLPASPAAALCPAAELPALLAAAAPRLRLALAEDAGLHQWQLTLRWPRETLMAQRRPVMTAEQTETAALAEELAYRGAVLDGALAPAVRRLQREAAGPLALRYLLLIPRDAGAAVEAVLRDLPAAIARGVQADLQGPLPPLQFHAWQVAEAEEQALRAAWSLLGLPPQVDLGVLHRGGRVARPETPAGTPGPRLAGLFSGDDLASLLPRARRRLIPCGGHAA
jgi:hypothetical protein